MARYKVTKQQLEMVVESFVMENSNRATRRKAEKINEDQLNEFLGLGKKIKNLVSTAREAANKVLNTMSDEEKSELASKVEGDDVKGLASKLNSLSPEEEKELATIEESLTEGGGAIKRFLARVLAIIGFPVTAVAGLLGLFVTGLNTGWSGFDWAAQLHDIVNSAVGSAGGPLSTVVFFLSFIFLAIGVLNWNAGKK